MVQRSHAVTNGVFVAAVNRVGHEDGAGEGLDFWGQSFVSDPFGVVLAPGSSDGEELLVVPCERGRLEEVRRNWPFFRDRRIDAYADLTRRWAGGPRA
jgi:N-carbamoylputrescine amidase